MNDGVINALAAGALVGAVLGAAAFLIRWIILSAKRVANSDAFAKAKDSASQAISASSDGISKAVKTGAKAVKAGAEIIQRAPGQNPNDKYDNLLKLKQLYDAGALTEEEFQVEKRKLLDA